jgi:hypothetical protein
MLTIQVNQCSRSQPDTNFGMYAIVYFRGLVSLAHLYRLSAHRKSCGILVDYKCIAVHSFALQHDCVLPLSTVDSYNQVHVELVYICSLTMARSYS